MGCPRLRRHHCDIREVAENVLPIVLPIVIQIEFEIRKKYNKNNSLMWRSIPANGTIGLSATLLILLIDSARFGRVLRGAAQLT